MSDFVFSEETTEKKEKNSFMWKVLVVDDEPEMHTITKLAFENTSFLNGGIEIVSAFSSTEALAVLKTNKDIAVVILDVVMEDEDSGLRAVKAIREILNNREVRIILRTGQPGYAPEREVIVNYDINDYKEKSELTSQKLFSSVISAIRAYKDIVELKKMSEELREAKESAESESNAKTLFLGNVSHEIRTPMNGIIGMLQLLKITIKDKNADPYMDFMEKSVYNLLEVIENILLISKLESGRIEPENKVFDFYQFFKSTIETYEVAAKSKDIQFEYNIDNNMPHNLYGDTGIIKRVLLSLLSNSFKFTKEGKISLEVTKVFQKENDIRIKFTLSDTGMGIEPEKLDVIFEPFVQGDLSNIKKYQGIGLGLSVSRRIIELMGGEIEIKSENGKGTTFVFFINAKKAE